MQVFSPTSLFFSASLLVIFFGNFSDLFFWTDIIRQLTFMKELDVLY